MRRAPAGLGAAALAAALLAGCAVGAGLQPGAPRAAVLASLGTPTATVPLPGGGERLQYSKQPFGQATWMADLDAQGRLLSLRQVLTQPEFERIVPGQWRRADVERELGPPARIGSVARWDGPILEYFWNDGRDRYWWVYLDRDGVVRRSHPGEVLRVEPSP